MGGRGFVLQQMPVHCRLGLPKLHDDIRGEIHLDVGDVLVRHKAWRISPAEHFIRDLDVGMLFQPRRPAVDDEGIEILLVENLPEDLFGILFELSLSRDVGCRIGTIASHLLFAAFGEQPAVFLF